MRAISVTQNKAEQVVRGMQTRRAFRHVNGFFSPERDPYYILHDETGIWFVHSTYREATGLAYSVATCLEMVRRGAWTEFDPPEE